MTNRMVEIAELLDVKLEEPFRIADDKNNDYPKYYRLSKKYGVETSCDNINWDGFDDRILQLLMLGEGKIRKLPWKPMYNEYYFIPEITTPEMFSSLEWTNDYVDNHMYKHGLICRTEEEAIRKAKLLLEYFQNNYTERNENNG